MYIIHFADGGRVGAEILKEIEAPCGEPFFYFFDRIRHISTVSLRIISIANRKTYPHRVYLFPLVDTLTKETEECTRREN